MAKSSKETPTKAASSAATKAKRGRKAKVVDPYPFPFDFRRPVADPQTEIAFGEALAAGKKLDPNKGLMTAKALGDSVRAQQAAEEAGEYAPSSPAIYSMIRRGAANRLRATCIISGQEKKGKKPLKSQNIPQKIADTFSGGDRVVVDGNGDLLPLRCHHKEHVGMLVDDWDSKTQSAPNLLSIRDDLYVVGTSEVSAVFLVNGSKTGNYGANITAGKALAFDGLGSKIKNLVGQVNRGFEIITLDDGTDPGCQYAIPPRTYVRWGHLVRDNKPMTPTQIRKAVESDDAKGIKFVILDEVIVGASFTKGKLWQAVKRAMGRAATKRGDGGDSTTALDRFEGRSARSGEDAQEMTDRAWHNLRQVQTRTNPNETFPFGLFNMQTGIVPVGHFGDSATEELVRFVIGAPIGAEYSENRWEANYRLNPDDYESDDATEDAAAPVTASVPVEADAESETVEAEPLHVEA